MATLIQSLTGSNPLPRELVYGSSGKTSEQIRQSMTMINRLSGESLGNLARWLKKWNDSNPGKEY